jgi:cell division protein FtsL
MSAIAEAPVAQKGRRAAEAPVAPKARRAPAASVRARAPFAGGVAWIVLIGVLLAGIVAVNVLVLQLNMQFDGLSRERAQLKADNARLRSQLSSASANVRIEEAATAELGLRAADPLTTTYVRLGER